MYNHSKLKNVRHIADRITCNDNKFVFKTENRIGTEYETSPFYRGTKLWNKLSNEVQDSEDILNI